MNITRSLLLAGALASSLMASSAVMSPKNVVASITAPGEVLVTWSPVTTTSDNQSLPPGTVVTYCIYDIKGRKVADNVSETQVKVSYTEPAQVEYLTYKVSTKINGSSSISTPSNYLAVGPTVPVPFLESFSNGQYDTNLLAVPVATGQQCEPHADDQWGGYRATDCDNGVHFNFMSKSGTAQYVLPPLDFTEAKNPQLSLYYYNGISPASANRDTLRVYASYDGKRQLVSKIMVGDITDKWPTPDLSANYRVSLAQLAGKKANIEITNEEVNGGWFAIDRIRIDEACTTDLCINPITGARVYRPCQPLDIRTAVANDGTTTVNGSDYKVAFYLNDKLLGKMEGQDIAPAQILPYVFDQGTVPAEATDSLNLQVVLEATDGNMANNQSAIYVPVTPLGLLGVENLQATAQGRDNVISWTAPQTQGVPMAVFEGFESYESWTHEVPGWKVIDTDASSTVAIYGLNLPGMTRDDPSTWTVLDWAATDLETNFANQSSLMQTSRPHLGGKSMACLVPNSTMGNDWLISPELSGEAQTVSLYASKLSWNYTEPWELRYSTTTTTTTAFKPITSPSAFKGGEAKIMIPAANFSHFEFNLPKGAKYIAVHYTSQGMMLELDDFAFTAKGNQQIQGYDVLRDGEVIATVTNSSYTDPNPAQASEYGVRVRYADGTLSLPVTVTAPEATVITQVEIDDNTTSNTAVYNLQGIKVGNTTTGLPAGIYITRGHKVIVK